jgi:ATP-binding cassette subfamily B protein
VINAAKAAQCHEFAQRLPNGYHTVIGPGRASFRRRTTRIGHCPRHRKRRSHHRLDEATAFADPENDISFRKRLKSLSEINGLIIAHRLSTVRSAGRIVVMEQGRLLEEGTHENF